MVILFRLINMLTTFQILINHILYKYLDDFVTVYLDNIIIFSKTLEEHIEHVNKILE